MSAPQCTLMSSVLQGQGLQAQRREADRALAARDPRIPGLNWVLDDELLSELLGESVRITRTRYKPHTSALVAFRRAGNGAGSYGWASTTTPEHVGETAAAGGQFAEARRRHPACPPRAPPRGRRRGGRPHRGGLAAAPQPAVAPGPGTRTARSTPRGRALPGPPGQRAADTTRSAGSSPGSPRRRCPSSSRPPSWLTKLPQASACGSGWQSHGIPVLPELADPECAAHGISASPDWGARRPERRRQRSGRLPGRRSPGGDPWNGRGTRGGSGGGSGGPGTPARRHAVHDHLPAPGARGSGGPLTGRLLAAVGAAGPHRQQPVLVHGDFSADQVLVDGPAVRIIDFDRVRTSDPARDLGSFAAVEDIADPAGAGPSPAAARRPS